ncbi:Helicase, superfamily 1/2, ATP-binding domain-containing protein [Cynara cardunculus var. scolymus]|uniref:Helicase, superfamily 1/2, ATP-binding domain-containing protein n=1 Tax=Cynara cardunculus var. scolymus TaxID=59895 RepID=A0A103XF45_CYNCS|nr:Helicase, superfamily 1/2, ATP-binding domain-containing protein [Cynara cardunculus var. scolymus]
MYSVCGPLIHYYVVFMVILWQGLGKTISAIALILKERSPPSSVCTIQMKENETETLNLVDDEEEDKDAMTLLDKFKQDVESCVMATNASSIEHTYTSVQTKSCLAAGTLVVCPTSVLRQWNEELQSKVSSEANLSILVYHGANRTKDPFELAKYDVVLTTYAIVSMEVPKQPLVDEDDDETKKRSDVLPIKLSPTKKRKYPPSSDESSRKDKKGTDNEPSESIDRPLAKLRWFRVILDEAQSIKNYKTQVARACWGLRAKRRWCLSGTPIQNSIDDLYSYFRFLRYDPLAVFKSFCSAIKAPIQRNPVAGYKKLQVILKTIMLRRTKGDISFQSININLLRTLSVCSTLLKGEPIISLPPKTIILKKVDFTAEERGFYRSLEADSRAQFAEYAAAGTVKQNYINILLMLLRLRQACDHPLLVRGCSSSTGWRLSVEKAKELPQEKLCGLLKCLEASLAICGICDDPPEDAVVTTCKHVFCNQCILEHLSSDDSHCPSSECKSLISRSSVFSKSTLEVAIANQPGQGNIPYGSGSVESGVLETSSFIGPFGSPKIEATKALDSSKIKAALEFLRSISKPQDITMATTSSSSIGGSAGNPEKSLGSISGVFDKDTNTKGNSVKREKAIVFSQWTGMLDLLEVCLKDSSIGYRRLDGTMSVVARDKAVKDFNTLPERLVSG